MSHLLLPLGIVPNTIHSLLILQSQPGCQEPLIRFLKAAVLKSTFKQSQLCTLHVYTDCDICRCVLRELLACGWGCGTKSRTHTHRLTGNIQGCSQGLPVEFADPLPCSSLLQPLAAIHPFKSSPIKSGWDKEGRDWLLALHILAALRGWKT